MVIDAISSYGGQEIGTVENRASSNDGVKPGVGAAESVKESDSAASAQSVEATAVNNDAVVVDFSAEVQAMLSKAG